MIFVTLGKIDIKKAPLDLGASVNILLGHLYYQYDLGKLEHTYVILQLADKPTKLLRGVLPNVIVKVDHFYYLVDLLVLDIENTCKQTHMTIILGRAFLATMMFKSIVERGTWT